MTHVKSRCWQLALVTLLVTSLMAVGGCSDDDDDGGGGGGGSTSTSVNLAPFFKGVKAVLSAGDNRILITWDAATDDNDASGQLRYRVYLSTTSGGQNFASPVATSGQGATSIQLTNSNSGLISSGNTLYVVVRALDTDGAEDTNTAEALVAVIASTNIAYVDSGAIGTGTLDDPTDPFPTIQDGVNAIPAAGGSVLIAGGTYNELVSVTDAGTAGSQIAFFGSLDAATFVAGATPQSILNGYDFDNNPTIVDGNGLDPTTVTNQIGHFDVRNNFRSTLISSIQFEDDESEILLGGEDVMLAINGCAFIDSDTGTTSLGSPSDGIFLQESAATQDQKFILSGSFFDELTDGVDLNGGFSAMRINSNRAEDMSSAFFRSAATIPTGADFVFSFVGNDVTRTNSNAFYMTADPETIGGSGTVTITITNNLITGCDTRCEVENFGEHGTGQHTILVENNTFGAIDSDMLVIDFLPGNNVDDEAIRGADVDVTIRDNTMVQYNSEAIELDDFTPVAAADVDVLVEDVTILQGDQEGIEVDPSFPTASSATFSQDGVNVDTVIQRVDMLTTDGGLVWEQALYRNGNSNITIQDCMLDRMTDEGMEIDLQRISTDTTSQPDDTANASLLVQNNWVHVGDESYEFLDVDFDVYGPNCTYEVIDNFGDASEEFIYTFIDFRDVPTANLRFDVLRNSGEGAEELVDVSFNYDDPDDTTLWWNVEGNRYKPYDDDSTVEISFNQNSSPTGNRTAYLKFCNNDLGGGREIFDWTGSSVEGIRGFLLIAHNTLINTAEGYNTNVDFYEGSWSGTIARNLMVAGGDDSEPGIQVETGGNAMLDLWIQNNIVNGAGSGIDARNDVNGGVQIINNTVVFTGHNPSDVAMGTNDGGVNGSTYVHNNVSYWNAQDIPDETIATYSIFDHPSASAGYGSILGDPIFRREGSIIDDPELWLALGSGSPAVNGGDPASEFNDTDGSRNDMGFQGGPGAGAMGALANQTDLCPVYLVGFEPQIALYSGASLVTGTQVITLHFSDDINGTTASSNIQFLENGSAKTGTFGTNGQVVTFTPGAAWTPGASVQVVLNTGLQSTDGRSLAYRHVRWFGVRPSTVIAETESNDTTGTANALTPASTYRVTGDLSSDTDVDVFSISATEGERLQVSLWNFRLNPSVASDMGLRLRDSTGAIIFDNDFATSGDESSSYVNDAGDPYVDYTVPASGTYYIEVYDVGSGAGAGPFNWAMEIYQR